MKLDHEEEPPLTEPYLSKQKKLMVSRSEAHGALCWWGTAVGMCSHLSVCLTAALHQAKILEHDNVNYLKKILGELGMVLDQIEAELEKRKLEYQGGCWAVFRQSTALGMANGSVHCDSTH